MQDEVPPSRIVHFFCGGLYMENTILQPLAAVYGLLEKGLRDWLDYHLVCIRFAVYDTHIDHQTIFRTGTYKR